MKVKVEKLNKDVILPLYATKGAAGFDFVANNFKMIFEAKHDKILYENAENITEHNFTGITLNPGNRALIGTGLKLEIPEGYELQVRPRSGLALNNGITVLNSPGTIDADYRGEVGIILINNSVIPLQINKGDRIAQGVLNKVEQIQWEATDKLQNSDRGEGGFGSTGITNKTTE